MSNPWIRAIPLLCGIALVGACATTAPQPPSQMPMHHEEEADAANDMWTTRLPGDAHLMAMAHVFPALTSGAPFTEDSPLGRTDVALPHAAAMMNLESEGSRWVLRLMPNFEGLTLEDGETTFGGWGEGFIDSRHPHTLLHEAMLSFNWWGAPGGELSVSAGRGFAPYGTEDPMYRPVLKYPTNHHLSQILERWTVSAAWLSEGGWGIEAGIFDGNEPEEWTDVGNVRDFPNSWSARLSRGFGGSGPAGASWNASVSFARVEEAHHDAEEVTRLYNVAVRHDAEHRFGRLYVLAEASVADPEADDTSPSPVEDYFSVLGEAQLERGPHRPYARVEYATRPEYPRVGVEGDPFFRYDHGEGASGATRWLISSAGYGHTLTQPPLAVHPFVEVQHHRVRHERGPAELEPERLFGASSFWSVSAGVRIFLGGGPMRMGTYGVLDPMTRGMRDGNQMEHDEMQHGDDHVGLGSSSRR